jgi:hypothetical protein
MKINLDHTFEAIESADFRYKANFAAGITAFKQIILESESFQGLLVARDDIEIADKIVLRIFKLMATEVDTRYENPYDTALATYLMVLDYIGHNHIVDYASVILELSKIWWAAKVAYEIMERTREYSTEKYTIRLM